MDTAEKPLSLLSLCTGYGGIERGLGIAGLEFGTVAHVEIEAYAVANLVSKMEAGELDPAPVYTNLKTLPLLPFRENVDILTGGYPCQPFSVAGKRRGDKDPRNLWPYICRIIDGIMPKVCFFENVDGHISLGLRQVLSDLDGRGYRSTWGIFSAKEVGAGHQRKRVFILASNTDRVRFERYIRGCKTVQGIMECLVAQKVFPKTEKDIRQPFLDREGDGVANGLDRLRLLGNGVVPQTAAKAWVTLGNYLKKAME